MTILILSKERRARVWIDEPPTNAPNRIVPAELHRRVNASGHSHSKNRSATVELFIPLGGRFLYGLLGCELVGKGSQTIDVSVPVPAKKELLFKESLAENLDTVWWGISDEYKNAVLDGAIAGVSRFGSPDAHEIQFCYAAHGEVSSSESIFKRLGMLAVAFLTLPQDPDLDVSEVLERIL